MPARLSVASSSWKPNGSMRCSVVWVAAHKRATLPVLGGISGSSRTTCMTVGRGKKRSNVGGPARLFASRTSPTGLPVEDFPEHQSVGRRRHPRDPPVLGGQHPLEVGGGELAAPKLHQRAGDAPAH